MTEREKMLAGQLYDPSDEELSHLRKPAFQLVERFNRLQKEDAAAQRETFGQYGRSCDFSGFCSV